MSSPLTDPNELGEQFSPGDTAFSHYTMKVGVVGSLRMDGWFYFQQADGTRDLLNGPRICSLKHARRMGWL